jgi:hypothetical protein
MALLPLYIAQWGYLIYTYSELYPCIDFSLVCVCSVLRIQMAHCSAGYPFINCQLSVSTCLCCSLISLRTNFTIGNWIHFMQIAVRKIVLSYLLLWCRVPLLTFPMVLKLMLESFGCLITFDHHTSYICVDILDVNHCCSAAHAYTKTTSFSCTYLGNSSYISQFKFGTIFSVSHVSVHANFFLKLIRLSFEV